MKKLFALAIPVALLFVTSNASAQAYKNGDKLLNIGIGVNSYYSGGIPLNASLEFGVTENISVGPSIDYLSNNYSGYKFTALYFGVRGSYHFSEILGIQDDKFDVYGGAGLGYRSFKWSDNYLNDLGGSYGNGIYFGIHIGAKYYVAPTIGIFAELGATGATNARVGVGFKF